MQCRTRRTRYMSLPRGIPYTNGLVRRPGCGPMNCACLLSVVCYGLGGEKGSTPVSTRLALHGAYDIWRRDELRAELDRLDVSGDVIIDLGATTLMDAGAAGLLIAFSQRLRQRAPSARVILKNTPRIVERVLELCGARELFVFTADG